MDAKGLVVDVLSSPPQSHGQWQAAGKNGVGLFLVIIIHLVLFIYVLVLKSPLWKPFYWNTVVVRETTDKAVL